MSEGLRSDLGQIAAAHAGLYKQIHDLSARVEAVDTGVAARVDGLGTSIALHVLEAGHGRLQVLLAVALVLLVAMLAFQAVIFIHTR